jgi:hypothetical protein
MQKIMVSKESKLFIFQNTEKRKGLLFVAFSETLKKHDKVASPRRGSTPRLTDRQLQSDLDLRLVGFKGLEQLLRVWTTRQEQALSFELLGVRGN